MGNFEILAIVVLIIALICFMTVMTILVSTYLLTIGDKKTPPITYENKDKIKCGDSESEVATTLTIGEDEKSEADS